MMMDRQSKETAEVGSEVFTEDGRKAIYAGQIDGQHFVRILLGRDDEEYGYEEWPADKLTPVSRVLATAPEERFAPAVEAAKADLDALRSQIDLMRENVLDLQAQERDMKKAIDQFPDLGTAIDFLSGAITHVVIAPNYGACTVSLLGDYLSMKSDYGRHEGVKLLCLFGVDGQKKCRWSVNRYYDGSGSWTEVIPFKSEVDAFAYVHADFEAELAAWRNGEASHKAHERCKAIPAEEWPEDWRTHVNELKAKSAAEQIARLHAQIAVIEAQQVLS
jgi:hypothetical protein